MAINWYSHHIGDYAKKTPHLTLLEHGCYRILLDYFYSNGGPFENDRKKIYRIVRAVTTHERRATDRVLDEFFEPTSDGLLTQTRAALEISTYNEIKEMRKKIGAIGGANSAANRQAKSNPPTPTPTPTVKEEERTPPTPSQGNPDDKPKRSRRAATLIDSTFQPDDAGIKIATALGFVNGALEGTVQEFIDYWRSIGKPMCDWQAAFRNRLRKLAARGGKGQSGQRGYGREPAGIVAAGLRVAARYSGKS